MPNKENDALIEYCRSQRLSQKTRDAIQLQCSAAVRSWRIRRALLVFPIVLLLFAIFLNNQQDLGSNIEFVEQIERESVPKATSNVSETKSTIVIAMKPHSLRCPGCARVDKVVLTLQEKYQDSIVQFAKLDYSSEEGRTQAKRILRDLGVDEIVQNPKTHSILTIHGKKFKKEIIADIDEPELVRSVEMLIEGSDSGS